MGGTNCHGLGALVEQQSGTGWLTPLLERIAFHGDESMKSALLVAATLFAASTGAALAQGGGGGNATGNNTSTSMGAPAESPGYASPRSSVVPGLSSQTRSAQRMNRGVARDTMMDKGKIPQAPRNPITGHAQTNP